MERRDQRDDRPFSALRGRFTRFRRVGRAWLRARTTALISFALAVIVAGVALYERTPPRVFQPPDIQLVIDTPEEIDPDLSISVYVDAPYAGPFGCGERTRVEVSVLPIGVPNDGKDKPWSTTLLVGDMYWLEGEEDTATEFTVDGDAATPRRLEPDNVARPADPAPAPSSPWYKAQVVNSPGRFFGLGAHYEFNLPLVARRAMGSCWVLMPSLDITAAGNNVARRALGYPPRKEPTTESASVRLSDLGDRYPDLSRPSHALNTGESVPEPNSIDESWECAVNGADDAGSPLATCGGAVGVADASWRPWIRDAALLLCGVLLSLGVELFMRVKDREASPTGGTTPRG